MSIGAFLLALIAIFAAAKLFGELAERIGQPAVLGELIGGIVIGVSALRLVDPHDPTIHLLAQLGVIILLFLIGLQTDLTRLLSVGGTATIVALAGVAFPFIGGAAAGYFLGYRMMVAVFVGASLTATSVGITARVLSDLGHLQDEEAQIILGAAIVDDVIGLVLLTLLDGVASGVPLTALAVARIIAIAFGFVFVAIFAGSYLAPFLIRTIERLDIARGLFFASIMFAFLFAYLAQSVGSAMIIGSFAAGLVLARTNRAAQIESEVHDIGQFFVPTFFVTVGAAVDLRSVNVTLGLILTAIGVLGKVAAGFCVWRSGVRRTIVGVGMIPRGEVGLIFAQIGLTSRLLNASLYSAVAMMVILTTLVTPPLLRALLGRSEPQAVHGEADLVTDAPADGDHMK